MNSRIKSESPQKIAEWLQWLIDNAHKGEISWQDAYGIIFSSDVSKVIVERFKDFNYYDPDMDYEDDVCAFAYSFIEYSKTTKDADQFSFDAYLTNFF